MEYISKKHKSIDQDGKYSIHQIFNKVNRSFITPIDQQDIIKLATLYDDVLDFIYAVMNRIVLYEVRESTPTMLKLAQLVSRSVDEIHAAFISMRRLDEDEIDKRCREIDRLENEAYVLLNDAVAELFKGKDVIQIMKLKEIYEYLETATDKCEDVSLVLRDVVMTRS